MLGEKVPEEGLRITRIYPEPNFDGTILVALGVYKDDLVKYLHSQKWPVRQNLIDSLNNRNVNGFHAAFSPKHYLVYTRRFPRNAEDHGTLAHEIFHLADVHIRRYHNTQLTDDTTEIYAHLIGLLTRRIYEQIYSWEIGGGFYRNSSGTAQPLPKHPQAKPQPYNPNWRAESDAEQERLRREQYLKGDPMPSLRK